MVLGVRAMIESPNMSGPLVYRGKLAKKSQFPQVSANWALSATARLLR
jgi:hypothetical protein